MKLREFSRALCAHVLVIWSACVYVGPHTERPQCGLAVEKHGKAVCDTKRPVFHAETLPSCVLYIRGPYGIVATSMEILQVASW